MKTIEKITEQDYDVLHENGNRISFDFCSIVVENFHIRLLDGYNIEKKRHFYILVRYFSDQDPQFYRVSQGLAFDILAQYSNLTNFRHYNRDLTERYFVSSFIEIIEGAK
jgi:hypothetical protein